MKRILAYTLSLFYLTSSVGVSLHVHECMGRIRSVSLSASATEKCPCGAFLSESGCCHDWSETLKIEADHTVSASVSVEVPTWEDARVFTPLSLNMTVLDQGKWSYAPHSPPPSPPQALYLLHSAFIYYG